jgi:cell division protein FtsI/penicillin-binding protein 2
MSKIKSDKYKISSTKTNLRIYILVFFVLMGGAAIIFRLYGLQVSAHTYYQELASDQHKMYENLIPKRGEIFARDGSGYYPVAVNREMALVYAVPREVENVQGEAHDLSVILQLDEGELKSKLDQPDGWYAVLKHDTPDDQVQQIKDKKLPGIYTSPESVRTYPAGNFASQIVGFVGSDGEKETGRYGLESYWNDELQGKEGRLEQERDTGGRWISIGEKNLRPAQDGANLYLTVDHTIQYRAEMAIKKAVEKYEADRGTIIVMDPFTGGVLAMASTPDFNPNDYSNVEDISVFTNPAVSDNYECGSIFKAITMAGGLDAGVVKPDTTYTDTGVVKEAGYEIHNSDMKANGMQTMTQVLEKSLNTGAIFVEKGLGNLRFLEYVKNFGLGEKTGIDTIGEASGNISGLKSMRNINAFTVSFGQGISVTPVQFTTAFAALANGGELMKPHLVDKIQYSDGKEQIFQPQEVRRVISKEASRDLAQMLVSVVQNGHGKRAAVPGYLVAGKTGTAQVPKPGGGYDDNQHIGSFAGFAPAYDPRFVMLVKLDNPRNVEWAESSAAPTFGEMAKFLLDYYGVEPTEEYSQKDVDLFNATHDVSIYQAPKEEEAQPAPTPEPPKEDKKKDKKKN